MQELRLLSRFQALSLESNNEKLRLYYRIGNALIEAKQKGSDPFAAIECVIPWDAFAQSLTDTQKLASGTSNTKPAPITMDKAVANNFYVE